MRSRRVEARVSIGVAEPLMAETYHLGLRPFANPGQAAFSKRAAAKILRPKVDQAEPARPSATPCAV
jgi:hypothetical protein